MAYFLSFISRGLCSVTRAVFNQSVWAWFAQTPDTIKGFAVSDVGLAASSRGGEHEYNALNHTIVPAHDKEAATRFFAQIFGLQYAGSAVHFACPSQ